MWEDGVGRVLVFLKVFLFQVVLGFLDLVGDLCRGFVVDIVDYVGLECVGINFVGYQVGIVEVEGCCGGQQFVFFVQCVVGVGCGVDIFVWCQEV